MLDLKRFNNLSREQFLELITRSYHNNCAAFVTDFTKLFTKMDGTVFKPYPLQVEVMNKLKQTDRIIVIIKPRQCLSYDTQIMLPDMNNYLISKSIFRSIEELYEENYRGKIATLKHDSEGNVKCGALWVTNFVKDIWYTGLQELFEIELENGETIKATAKHKFNTFERGFIELEKLIIHEKLFHINGLIAIKDIRRLEGLHRTYDISVETNNSYFANKIHVHNSGFSTAAAVARPFHSAYFGKRFDNVIISATKIQALKIIRRIHQSIEELPEILQPKLVVDTAGEIQFANKSRIISLSSNIQQMKGWTGDFYWDEAASFTQKESEDIYSTIYPSTTQGGSIIIISTPFGNEGMYFRLANETLSEIAGHPVQFESKKIIVNWQEVPFIAHAVKYEGLFDGLSQEMREQEYELKFIVANLDEQYFPREFILSTLRDRDGTQMPLYTSYSDLGISALEYIGDKCENMEKLLDPFYYKGEKLRETYDRIVGGWDIASGENDSILTVDARLRDKHDMWHRIGYFKVNRVNTRFHDTIIQAQYIKRIVQCLDIDYVNMDANGLGDPVHKYLIQDKNLGRKFNAFKLQKDDKYYEFVRYKQRLGENRIKMRWENENLMRDMVQQYTNMHLNKMNLSLAAKGINKDDAAYSGMLAQSERRGFNSGIHFI